MPATQFGNLVWETTTTTGTGTLSLAGAKDPTWRRFRDERATGETVQYVLRPAGSNDYELHHGVLTHGSPDTLTRSASTMQRSSTGGLIDLPAGTHDVMIAPAASRLFVLERLHSGFIELPQQPLAWDSATQIRLKGPGRAMVNGKLLEWSSDIVRSFTPSSAGQKNVYLYDSGGGTAALEINDTNIAPVRDVDLDCWKKTGDASRRNVGSIWVYDGAAPKIMEFISLFSSRILQIYYLPPASPWGFIRPVSSGESKTAWASIALSGFGVPAEATHWYVAPKINFSATSNDAILGLAPKNYGTKPASEGLYTAASGAVNSNSNVFFGRTLFPLAETQTAYYRLLDTVGSSSKTNLETWGYQASL
jgi:hypothetical protein